MSASPSQLTQSSKRPLEDEASSPSRLSGQPDAKRPALDKAANKNDEELELAHMPEKSAAANHEDEDGKAEEAGKTNGVEPESANAPGESPGEKPVAAAKNGGEQQQVPASTDETSWIHIRAVISSPEAATVIGKSGENVSNIRKMSGAKCTVSDYRKGAVERILTVSGVVDHVAKAFGLIIRTLNNEPLGEASTAQSKTYPLRLLVPHILIGSIIGKGGARIREIQEASGARLNASDTCLPLSSERSLVVMGVADAVHIATYYVGSTLLEQLTDRFGGPAASAYATRSGSAAGYVPGGMQVVPYQPMPAGGGYGNRENYARNQERWSQERGPGGPYGDPYAHHPHPHPHPAAAGAAAAVHHPAAVATAMGGGHYGPQAGAGAGAGYGGGGGVPHAQAHGGPSAYGGQQPHGGPQGQPPAAGGAAPVTQQIFIPNDMVGAIIGKGGQKINEIRQTSGSVIKINEPQDNSNERLVTISGTAEANRIALYMLYTRLGELQQENTTGHQ